MPNETQNPNSEESLKGNPASCQVAESVLALYLLWAYRRDACATPVHLLHD
jgi:hypothetical protein